MKVVTVELVIAEDGCQQTRSDAFPCSDRDDCSSAMAVTQEQNPVFLNAAKSK